MSPDETRAWYEDYLDACNRHDLDGMRRFLHPEVRRAGEPRGADAWIADIDALLTAFPDYRWKRITVLVEGDRLAAHLRTRGTHRGEYHGVSATGRHVGLAEFAFYRLQDGRIAEYAGTADDAGLLAQLQS